MLILSTISEEVALLEEKISDIIESVPHQQEQCSYSNETLTNDPYLVGNQEINPIQDSEQYRL